MPHQHIRAVFACLQLAFIGLVVSVCILAFFAKLDRDLARQERECQEACVKW